MRKVLRLVPKLCYIVGTIILVGQSYYLIDAMLRGYGYDFPVNYLQDMPMQLAMIWLKLLANSLVWFAFGLLASLLIRATDELAQARAALLDQSARIAQDA